MLVSAVDGRVVELQGGLLFMPGSYPSPGSYPEEYYDPTEYMTGVVVERPTKKSCRILIQSTPSSWYYPNGNWPRNVTNHRLVWADGERCGVYYNVTNAITGKPSPTVKHYFSGGFGDDYPPIDTPVKIYCGFRRYILPRTAEPGKLWAAGGEGWRMERRCGSQRDAEAVYNKDERTFTFTSDPGWLPSVHEEIAVAYQGYLYGMTSWSMRNSVWMIYADGQWHEKGQLANFLDLPDGARVVLLPILSHVTNDHSFHCLRGYSTNEPIQFAASAFPPSVEISCDVDVSAPDRIYRIHFNQDYYAEFDFRGVPITDYPGWLPCVISSKPVPLRVYGPSGQIGRLGDYHNAIMGGYPYWASITLALWSEPDDDVVNVSLGFYYSTRYRDRLAGIPRDVFTTGEIAFSGESPDGVIGFDNVKVRRIDTNILRGDGSIQGTCGTAKTCAYAARDVMPYYLRLTVTGAEGPIYERCYDDQAPLTGLANGTFLLGGGCGFSGGCAFSARWSVGFEMLSNWHVKLTLRLDGSGQDSSGTWEADLGEGLLTLDRLMGVTPSPVDVGSKLTGASLTLDAIDYRPTYEERESYAPCGLYESSMSAPPLEMVISPGIPGGAGGEYVLQLGGDCHWSGSFGEPYYSGHLVSVGISLQGSHSADSAPRLLSIQGNNYKPGDYNAPTKEGAWAFCGVIKINDLPMSGFSVGASLLFCEKQPCSVGGLCPPYEENTIPVTIRVPS